MIRHSHLLILCLLLTGAAAPFAQQATQQSGATRGVTKAPESAAPASATKLAERLEAIRREDGVPALGAALLRNGEIVELAVTGVTRAGGEEAVAPEDAWHIGSCTKAMTATVAARLIEQGKLNWDTTLAQGLPDLAADMHEAHKSVTLRQLLGHRGGIIGHEANSLAMPMLWGIEQQKDRPMRQRRTEAAQRILKAPPAGEVGKEFRYSNYGYVLVGAMLERAGDASWEELMQREIFEPLGMQSAGFGPPPRIAGHIKAGEEWKPQDRDNPLVMGPAGTVHMSLSDWGKFAAAHLGQVEGYLKPETLAILHEPLPGEGASYASGWSVRKNGNGEIVQLSHAGSNTMWYAIIVLDPAKGEARVAAANGVNEKAVNEALAIAAEKP